MVNKSVDASCLVFIMPLCTYLIGYFLCCRHIVKTKYEISNKTEYIPPCIQSSPEWAYKNLQGCRSDQQNTQNFAVTGCKIKT